jgi:GTP cyclohydrolase I
VDHERLLWLGRELLLALGEDPEREGLRDTPKRFANWWREFIEYDPGELETTFESVNTDQLVIVSGMRVWSLCEHHLLPFWCDVAIAYLVQGEVLGLSKFARIANKIAHRLQIQERLVTQIADDVCALTGTEDVAVMARGEHLCMSMRGIQTPAILTSAEMRGKFRQNTELRAEFLSNTRS